MTALPQYELLEAEGRYFDGRLTTPREVIVKFGDASLIILDADDMPMTHWPLATLRSETGAGAELSLSPDPGGVERLLMDDPVMIEALRAVCPELDAQRTEPTRPWRRIAIWAGAALVAVYAAIFHLLPALSDQLADLIPPKAEIAMGESMTDRFAQIVTGQTDPRFCTSPDGVRALRDLTARLEASANSHVPLTVRVLDDEMVSTFALPGGQILLSRGLLALADGPEEIAGVLAHEIAHVVRRDPTHLTLRSAGTTGILGVLFGDFTGAGATAALSDALLTTGYRPETEAAADRYAIDLLARQGLPTAPFAQFFLKLKDRPAAAPATFSHLSAHPDLAARAHMVGAADTVAGAPFEPALTDQQWVALRGICR